MPLQTVEPQRLYRQIAEQLRALIDDGRVHAGQPAAGRARPGQAARREPALGARSADRAGGRRLGRGAHRLGRLRAGARAARRRRRAARCTPGRMGPAGADPRAPLVEGEIAVAGRHAGQAQAHRRRSPARSTHMREDADARHRAAGRATAPSTPPSRRPAATWCCSKPCRRLLGRAPRPAVRAAGRLLREPCRPGARAIAEHEAVLEAIRAHDAPGRARRHAAAPGQVPRPIQRELAPRQPFLMPATANQP